MLMTCDMGNRVTLKDGATQATQLCVLGVLEGIAFESFKLNANTVIVAVVATPVKRLARMPCPVIAADELPKCAISPDKKMA